MSNMRRMDKIVVVDLEATCWDGGALKGVSEIIEVGVCLLDHHQLGGHVQAAVSDALGILVHPVESEISPFCTQLTTITPEMVARDGHSFDDACSILVEKYHSDRRTWASYGDFDRIMFGQQCSAHSVPYPFGKRHLNVKNLFALKHRLDKEVGMPRALQMIGLSLEGTHHRGVDDACNIAKILHHLLI